MKRVLILFIVLFIISQAQEIVWMRTFRPYWSEPDMVIDSRNNVLVVAFPHLRKYSPDGELLWDIIIDPEHPGRLRLDLDRGDSIVVGRSIDSTWIIRKYSPCGESLWRREIVFPPESTPSFRDIAIDNQNSILVTGFNEDYYGWVTYKLSLTGEIKWGRTFTSDWGPDMYTYVCADDSLNVIVGGVRGVSPMPRSWYPQVFKYSETGDSLWAVCYFDSHCGNYFVGELTVDRQGNVILPGSKLVYGPFFAFLFKYDRQGNYLWRWFADSTTHSEFCSCVTDTAGNIFVGATRTFPDRLIVVEVWKFSPDGESLWVFSYPLGPRPHSFYYWFEIDLDNEGDILVAVGYDTLVYIFKITERTGILEKGETKTRNYLLPKTIFSKRKFNLNLPTGVKLISIYNKSGKLIKEIKPKESSRAYLDEWDLRAFPSGIYFIKLDKGLGGINKIIILD